MQTIVMAFWLFGLQVLNPASGALDKEATITVDEMLEHAFYQVLNLAQILYLHSASYTSEYPDVRAAALLLVTLPWAARARCVCCCNPRSMPTPHQGDGATIQLYGGGKGLSQIATAVNTAARPLCFSVDWSTTSLLLCKGRV